MAKIEFSLLSLLECCNIQCLKGNTCFNFGHEFPQTKSYRIRFSSFFKTLSLLYTTIYSSKEVVKTFQIRKVSSIRLTQTVSANKSLFIIQTCFQCIFCWQFGPSLKGIHDEKMPRHKREREVEKRMRIHGYFWLKQYFLLPVVWFLSVLGSFHFMRTLDFLLSDAFQMHFQQTFLRFQIWLKYPKLDEIEEKKNIDRDKPVYLTWLKLKQQEEM